MSQEFNPYEFPIPPSSERAEEPSRTERIEREVVRIEPAAPTEQEEEHEELTPQERELTAEEQAQIEAEKEAKRIAREKNPFWQFISGNWLILEGITGSYRYMLVVAATLFLSVVTIFYSFHLAERYTRRSAEVQLLRERHLEYSRSRFNATSHTAILKELKARGIPVYDIQESKTVIEK